MLRNWGYVQLLFIWGAYQGSGLAQKALLHESIHSRAEQTWATALQIWDWAEPGYQEKKSSQLLAAELADAGFSVQLGVAEIPTALMASFGDDQPVIGILGEYDALPGLSQKAIPSREPVREGAYGQGCGHHLFGAASMSAAIALAEQIKSGQIKGTVRFYGCPAEEGGSAKVFMVRAGLFNDCAVVLHWHPSAKNSAGDRGSLARNAVKFRFHGKAAHAAGQPEQGRSALDAVELTNHAAQLLREHTPDQTRIHHVITYGGGAPNVVPDLAEVYYYVRHPDAEVVRELYRRLVLCAEAGALATETRLEIDFQGGIMQLLPNSTLAEVALRNLRALNDLEYTPEDALFAARIQETMASPFPLETVRDVYDETGQTGMGSTDVGDVSWVVPTTGFTTACFVPGTPGHSWQVVACGATPIARRGMQLAARVLAATAWDIFQSPDVRDAAQAELAGRLGERAYQALMPPAQEPPLNYRQPLR